MNDPPYEYQPLPQGNFIRILHVDGSVNHRQPVCTFETILLGADSRPYYAISYTWGDSTPVRHVICSDGQRLGLSRTLSSLLDALLKRENSIAIFIDALCINQNDLVEKAHQVRIIGNVYSFAHMVIVWLGEGDEQTQKAFQYMRDGTVQESLLPMADQLSNEDRPDTDVALPSARRMHQERQGIVDALMALLTRRWFQRVWVVQEAILGSTVLVACGDDNIDFHTFRLAISSLWHYAESVDSFDIRHPSYLGIRCAGKLFDLQYQFQARGKISLEYLFEAMFNCSATDTRDFIFAIRGIADSVELLPKPNYTASIDTIFTDTAENLFCKGGSLDGLSLCGLGPSAQASSFREYCGQPPNQFTAQLPSWVLDFRQLAYNDPILVCNKADWDAGGPLVKSPFRTEEGLRVHAVILDGIVRVSDEMDTMRFDELRRNLHAILELASNGLKTISSHQVSDIVWKTLVFDMDLDERPAASAELRLAFEGLLQALDSGRSWEEVKRNEFYRIIRIRTDSWSTFVSSRGYIGVTWPLVEEKDYVCLLPGCRFPLIIRPLDSESSDPSKPIRGSLIGWCYVHGIMHGEAVQEPYEENVIVLL